MKKSTSLLMLIAALLGISASILATNPKNVLSDDLVNGSNKSNYIVVSVGSDFTGVELSTFDQIEDRFILQKVINIGTPYNNVRTYSITILVLMEQFTK